MSLESYRQAVSAAKQADIVKAALAHFLKRGFTRAGMVDIARDADVSTATLYKHCTSKEDLFATVCVEAARAVDDEFASRPPGKTLVGILRAACRQYIAVQYDGHMNALLRIVIAEAVAHPKLARKMFEIVVDRRRDRVAGILAKIVDAGYLKPHDTQLSATLLGGMMKELFVWPAMLDPDHRVSADAETEIAEIVDLFLSRYGA